MSEFFGSEVSETFFHKLIFLQLLMPISFLLTGLGFCTMISFASWPAFDQQSVILRVAQLTRVKPKQGVEVPIVLSMAQLTFSFALWSSLDDLRPE